MKTKNLKNTNTEDIKNLKMQPSIYSYLTKLLEKRLKLKNVTQEDVAKQLNCTTSLYAQFERGKHHFQKFQIDIICNYLGIKNPELYFEIDKNKKGHNRIKCKASTRIYKISALKKLRIEKKLTQDFVASVIGHSRQHYMAMESGRSKIRKEIGKNILEVLETNASEVFDEIDNDFYKIKIVRNS